MSPLAIWLILFGQLIPPKPTVKPSRDPVDPDAQKPGYERIKR
jgi:hypothetical protein